MSNPTHQSRLARQLSTDLNVPYRQTLEAVRAAAAAQVLPLRLEGPGMRAAYVVVADLLNYPTPAPTLAPPALVREREQRPTENVELPLGVSLSGSLVGLSQADVRTHGLILGATGSGKSETIKALAGCLLDLGWSGIVIDLKEDTGKGGLRDWCFDYSTYHSTPFQQLCLSDPNSETWFNPLSGMGPDEVCAVVLSLVGDSERTPPDLTRELVLQLSYLLAWAHQVDPDFFVEPSLQMMAQLLKVPSLPAATKAMRAAVLAELPQVTTEDLSVLSSPSKTQAETASWLGSLLSGLHYGHAARAALQPGETPSGVSRRELDLLRPGLTYFGLDSQGETRLTRTVSSSVLAQLTAYARLWDPRAVEGSTPRFVIIDEANWVDRKLLQTFLARARAGGISVWLCTQGPKDWIDQTGDDWGKLTNNINVAIIMRQGEPESAELCAEYLGKAVRCGVEGNLTPDTLGDLAKRQARHRENYTKENFELKTEVDYRFSPDQLRELSLGEAIVRVGAPSLTLRYAKILMRDPKASPHRG